MELTAKTMQVMMEVSPILLLLLSPVIPFLYPCLKKFFLRIDSQIATNKIVADQEQRLPPGRTGWPFLGETLDFYSKAQKGVLENFVTERSVLYSSKIFKTSLIGHPIAVLYGAEGNKFLFSNEKKLLQHWWPSSIDKLFPNSGKRTNAERAQSMRKFISSILKGDALREYVGILDATIKQQLEREWNCHEEVIKVSDAARRYTFTSACRIFLGVDDPWKIDELEKGIKIIATGLHSTPINFPGTALNRGIKASKIMRKEFEAMIRQRKVDFLNDHQEKSSSPSAKDFISQILVSTDDNGQFINEEDMASHLTGLLQAAYASVHSTLTNVMKYLAEFPHVYNLVLREQKEIASSKEPKDHRLSWEDVRKMKYSWDVVCEVLRLLPPGVGGFKEAITDLNYGGYTIPEGWKIHWNTYATHKNPEYFPDPEKFDPSRFQGDGPAPYTFVPFGGGSRMCPGNDYARLAILIFLHNVVTKFRWEKQNPDEEVFHDPLPRPAQGLPVYIYPHKS